MTTTYKLENIALGYNSNIILNNLNLEIKSKRLTVITGKSGSGKSTLLYLLGSLLDPIDGHIYLDDYELPKSNTQKSRDLLKNKIGFLFQNFALIDTETVLQNLSLVSSDKKLILETLRKFNLEDKINFPVSKLSGGEQQRVAICKIIIKDPDIILADEPTGSLDTDNEMLVIQMLQNFVEEGKTVIVVTHSNIVSSIADEVIHI